MSAQCLQLLTLLQVQLAFLIKLACIIVFLLKEKNNMEMMSICGNTQNVLNWLVQYLHMVQCKHLLSPFCSQWFLFKFIMRNADRKYFSSALGYLNKYEAGKIAPNVVAQQESVQAYGSTLMIKRSSEFNFLF